MKLKELRIGNWVFDDENKPCQISLLTSEKRDAYEGEVPEFQIEYKESENIFVSDVINPIPLTEEWLLKFGFFSHENRPRPVYGNNSFIYFYKQDGIFWSDLMHGTIEIKYVHQLQNLYHALTGKELIAQ